MIMTILLLVELLTGFMEIQTLIFIQLPLLFLIMVLVLKKETLNTRSMIRYIRDYQFREKRSENGANIS